MRRRRRRWWANVLLAAGVAAIDVWIWSHAGAELYQRWEERRFERMRRRTAEAPAVPQPRRERMGRLTIPRLHLRTMVREGTGESVLSLAAGHIPSTAWPGEQGNVAVAAHRDTLFRGLKNIRQNDLILFETPGGSYRYRVESTRVVKPDDVSVLRAGKYAELTLVTCYPFYYVGNAPERFVVKAREVTGEDGPPRGKDSL